MAIHDRFSMGDGACSFNILVWSSLLSSINLVVCISWYLIELLAPNYIMDS